MNVVCNITNTIEKFSNVYTATIITRWSWQWRSQKFNWGGLVSLPLLILPLLSFPTFPCPPLFPPSLPQK